MKININLFNKASSVKVWILFLSGILSVTTGCATNSSSQNPIKIDGSSTVYPITQLAAKKKFNNIRPNTNITVQEAGTEAGFRRFCTGETDVNDASRPILLREMDVCRQNGVTYFEFPIAFDALTIAVNSENDWAKDITIAELTKLWSVNAEGQIKNWNQVRATWPNKPLTLYGHGKDSGTLDYLTKALGLPEHGVRSDYNKDSDGLILASKVGKESTAIGFFGYASYSANSKSLRALAIDNGKGSVLPSLETVQKSQYQPFSRPLILYVSVQSARVKPEVKEFVEYYLKNADVLAKESGYFPLPAEAYEMNAVNFYKGKVGTVFAGETQIDVTISSLLRKESVF